MKLNIIEAEQIRTHLKEYLPTDEVQSMKSFVQHGETSTFKHCMSVVRLSYLLNKRLHLGADEHTLLSAALLHDFYLYDWHEKSDSHKLHGFTHAGAAADNAKLHFSINHKTERAIRTHMWPLNLTKLPTSREGWILCVADKCCALGEVFRG